MAAVLNRNDEEKILPYINGETVAPSTENGKNTIIINEHLIEMAGRGEQNESLHRQRKMLYRRLKLSLRNISVGKAAVGRVAKLGGSGVVIKGIVHSITENSIPLFAIIMQKQSNALGALLCT